jgi:hypothetical protein
MFELERALRIDIDKFLRIGRAYLRLSKFQSRILDQLGAILDVSAYLRPMGVKVPAIYVESADEPYPPADGTTSADPPPAF